MNNLEQLTRDIGRLHTSRHAWLMYGLCKWLNVRSALEIGAWHGFCSVYIATAIKENGGGLLTIIDDFSLQNDCAALHNNLRIAGVSDMVEVISAPSDTITELKSPVEFAFIDGDHSLNGCVKDCNLAIEHGAHTLCIHDTVGWWGPRDYIEIMRDQGAGHWDVIEGYHDSGLAVLRKRQPKPEPIYSEAEYPAGCV